LVILAAAARQPLENQVLRAMFEARKQVFVDLLKWDVPVLQGRYEVDQFDDAHAVYLIVTGAQGQHLGSARLLKTVRPHILDTLFATLSASPPPRGDDVLEITRFCLGRNQSARERLVTRNALVTALAGYALEHGIATYTGVAELAWLQQILAFGWRCRPLGIPKVIDGRTLGALRIEITPETPALLADNGIHTRVPFEPADALEAA